MGSYHSYSSLVKLQPVPEFAVKDLPLGRTLDDDDLPKGEYDKRMRMTIL